MIVRLMGRLAPELDVQALANEVRERISEELDYELEAANQRAIARLHRGHPFIFVPDVVGSLSSERVLVTDFVAGTGFEDLKQRSAEERNRVAEIIFRFYFGCMYRHHQVLRRPASGQLPRA